MKTQQQKKEMGWCPLDKINTGFTSTLNPKGKWVCGNCRFTTSKLLKQPLNPIPYPHPFLTKKDLKNYL